MNLEPNTVVAALDVVIPMQPVSDEQVVAGSPETGSVPLSSVGDAELGVWEMTPGSMSDVETEEIFIVLAGRARVDFVATGESVELGPGSVGRLSEGTATVWTVAETLRKIYLA
jgi:uncharacterized cupin superfamily protein